MKVPVTRYRPVRTKVEGDFTESMSDGVTIWGSLEVDDATIALDGVAVGEDVDINDVIRVPD